MSQWLDVETEETDGLADLELPMTSDPALGEWKIKAVHQGKTIEQKFTVDEYGELFLYAFKTRVVVCCLNFRSCILFPSAVLYFLQLLAHFLMRLILFLF